MVFITTVISRLVLISPLHLEITDAITISNLDTTMLRKWFSTNTDTTDLNDGIVLRPTNSNIYQGFYSFNNSDTPFVPTLYITYIDTNGNSNSYSHKIGFQNMFQQLIRQASLQITI